MRAAIWFGVILQSAGLATIAAIARGSSNDLAADSEQGVFLALIFWDSQRTCWTRVPSNASTSEYPFALIAAGIESQVTWFASQARKMKIAAFFARSSTLFFPLWSNEKMLASGRDKWVVQTMSPEEREAIMVKHHYRPRVSRLWRMNPRWYDPANDAQ
jgi:hypothetical protein